jgi:hypothetical protein
VIGWAPTWADHQLQGIWRCEVQALNTKNYKVQVHLTQLACIMCHSSLRQLLIQIIHNELHKTGVCVCVYKNHAQVLLLNA